MARDPDFERNFDEYRERLHDEISRLATDVRIYRRLHERRADRIDEMNVAPAFFQLVTDALFSVIVIWIDKLFDERGGAGFFNFLTYVEYNRSFLSLSELKRRRQYPDGDWMLSNRESITLVEITSIAKQFGSLKHYRNSGSDVTSSRRISTGLIFLSADGSRPRTTVVRLIQEHEDEIRKAWKAHFGS